MRSRVPRGCDSGTAVRGQAARMPTPGGDDEVARRPGRRRRPSRVAVLLAVTLAALAATATAACGGGDDADDDDGALTGRVTAKTEQGYCVSPDRGATTSCIPLDQADDEAEVGQCVRITDAPTPDARRLSLADESACAAGDLGDDAPGD